MKIPKSEYAVLTPHTADGSVYVITAKINIPESYTAYKQNGNDYERLGTGKSPSDLEKRFIKYKRGVQMQRALIYILIGLLASSFVIMARDAGRLTRLTDRQYKILIVVSVFTSQAAFALLVALVS